MTSIKHLLKRRNLSIHNTPLIIVIVIVMIIRLILNIRTTIIKRTISIMGMMRTMGFMAGGKLDLTACF